MTPVIFPADLDSQGLVFSYTCKSQERLTRSSVSYTAMRPVVIVLLDPASDREAHLYGTREKQNVRMRTANAPLILLCGAALSANSLVSASALVHCIFTKGPLVSAGANSTDYTR